jgi:hypothetical protein
MIESGVGVRVASCLPTPSVRMAVTAKTGLFRRTRMA